MGRRRALSESDTRSCCRTNFLLKLPQLALSFVIMILCREGLKFADDDFDRLVNSINVKGLVRQKNRNLKRHFKQCNYATSPIRTSATTSHSATPPASTPTSSAT